VPNGAKSLLAYLEDYFWYVNSLGICNCRNVGGSSSLSHHANCRALDAGIPTNGGLYIPAWGDPLIELLGPFGDRLGLDHLILNRRIYSARSPDGRYYGGVSPHNDHAHIGLSHSGAVNLNYATLVAVLGLPTGVQLPGDDEMNALKRGDKGNGVGWYQTALNEKSAVTPKLVVDQDFGPKTEAAVKQYQEQADFTKNGVIDGALGPLIAKDHPEMQGGEKGDKGDKGATGARGATGAQGATGAAGTPGANGSDGDDGAAGKTGATGAKGATGSQGEDGATGPQGEPGVGLEPGQEIELGTTAKVL